MNDAFSLYGEELAPTTSDDPCRIAIIYDERDSRQRAMGISDHLLQVFWPEIEIEFSWWKESHLQDPEIGPSASQAAADADLIIFAFRQKEEMSSEFQRWIESWVDRRAKTTGGMAALIGPSGEPASGPSSLSLYFGQIAKRACMDFLTPSDYASTESTSASVGSLTPWEDRLFPAAANLHLRHSPSTRWGINE